MFNKTNWRLSSSLLSSSESSTVVLRSTFLRGFLNLISDIFHYDRSVYKQQALPRSITEKQQHDIKNLEISPTLCSCTKNLWWSKLHWDLTTPVLDTSRMRRRRRVLWQFPPLPVDLMRAFRRSLAVLHRVRNKEGARLCCQQRGSWL